MRDAQARGPTDTTVTLGPRIRQERRTIDAMIGIYCRDHHGGSGAPCADCRQLQDYAHRRLEVCPFGEHKPACNRCTVHCYSAAMRERVRDVMRYAGPRMPLRHPWLALLHLLDKLRRVPVLPRRRRPGRPRPAESGGEPASRADLALGNSAIPDSDERQHGAHCGSAAAQQPRRDA